MNQGNARRAFGPWPWLAAGAIGVAVGVIVVRTAPAGSPVSQGVQRVEAAVRQVVAASQDRLARAKLAYADARAQSERVLLSQLQEAKQRGSLPPV
jgi:hypothetical protein